MLPQKIISNSEMNVISKVMISEKAKQIHATLTRGIVDPSASLLDDRRSWNKTAAALPLANGTVINDITIADIPCLKVSVDAADQEKKILYAHGGGLVTGSATTHRQFASYLSASTNAEVTLIDYRLLPEHPVLQPRDDIASVYREMVESNLAKPDKIIFAGDSSGAGAALSSLIKLRDERVELPSGFISFSGAFDVSLSGETMKSRNEIDPISSFEELKSWQQEYFAGKIALDAPEVSPLFAELFDLPPTLLIAGDHEVWLSDTLRLNEKLSAAGGKVDLKVYDDMWHCFVTDVELPQAINANNDAAEFIEGL